jgi:hypothetical protein
MHRRSFRTPSIRIRRLSTSRPAISYHLGAEGTPYLVAAGVYDDKLTIAQLSKLNVRR